MDTSNFLNPLPPESGKWFSPLGLFSKMVVVMLMILGNLKKTFVSYDVMNEVK